MDALSHWLATHGAAIPTRARIALEVIATRSPRSFSEPTAESMGSMGPRIVAEWRAGYRDGVAALAAAEMAEHAEVAP